MAEDLHEIVGEAVWDHYNRSETWDEDTFVGEAATSVLGALERDGYVVKRSFRRWWTERWDRDPAEESKLSFWISQAIGTAIAGVILGFIIGGEQALCYSVGLLVGTALALWTYQGWQGK